MHEMMEILKTNLSHIFGSRREIVIKVFSKFAGRLREETGSLKENGFLFQRLASISSSGKSTVL